MIVNSSALVAAAPIKNMVDHKVKGAFASHGLAEAGYDIRLAQDIWFTTHFDGACRHACTYMNGERHTGHFILASTMEEFQMPTHLVGVVHDKSTWARHGLSVFNTVIEPGWNGFLTLELVYHGHKDLIIPAGTGIAQVLFHALVMEGQYEGKYQNQENKPVSAR